MTDKPDPAKDAGRTDAAQAKRPHATLDLKATEVKAAQPPAPGTPSATSTAQAASSADTSASGATTSASGGPSGKASSTADAASKPAAPGASPKAAPAAKNEPAAGRSGGGFFSHLAAGIVGGALVYAGAGLLGLSGGSTGDTSRLAARITALETAPKDTADLGALSAKIGDADQRLAKLDELERTVSALREAQSALQAETKSLSEATQRGDATASAERIQKLEEQLSMIAAGSATSDGRVPQLAAISGKISDVETSLATQIAELRKSLPADLDQRIAATQETSEAAKSATARFDREFAQVRTEQARGQQKADAAKADTDRLSAAVDAVKGEANTLTASFGELRSAIDSRLKGFAKPEDVAAAIGPVNSKLAELEQNVQGVVNSEQSRRQNAERIVLSLELSNLKRALDRGQGSAYAAELESVRKTSAGQLDLAPLERFKDTGVATPAQLKAEFRPLINAVLDADTESPDGSVIDRLLSGAKSVVRVRKISHEADDSSTEATVARMEEALNDGRLGDVLAQAKALPQRARVPIEDWLIKVTARDTVDQAIAAVETRLKASLSGVPEEAAPAAPPAAPAPQQN